MAQAQGGEAPGTGHWDESFDVVVVGFGGAGAAAALEAHARGARVVVLDRFQGGGATERSGGVVYLGGGSAQQKAAGYDDDPEQMFRYLQCETQGVVDDDTLRAFCDQSLDTLALLENLGVPFTPQGDAPKVSYPDGDVTLYFSGNELSPPYSEAARTAPRGHRVQGKGLTGPVLFQHIRKGVLARGIDVRTACEARELVTDDQGEVVGVELRSLPRSSLLRGLHQLVFLAASFGGMFSNTLARWGRAVLAAIENRWGEVKRFRARGGVVLCAGGFIYNKELTARVSPLHAETMPLGTLGDDGSGIAMGEAVGGATGKLDRFGAWRFINPPVSLTHGVLVDREGRRICNEELYGATVGQRIADSPGGKSFLVIDETIRQRILDENKQLKINYQSVTAYLNLFVNRKKASSLDALARTAGLPVQAFVETIEAYNERARSGRGDELGKADKSFHALETPPYYAIVTDLSSGWFPTPC
ncbi:MAG: FAD-binding protein, partial [Deltaproteobacteria bacterium]|nr:FAD-binding protein [Deltaproteobacteria bacterium]